MLEPSLGSLPYANLALATATGLVLAGFAFGVESEG